MTIPVDPTRQPTAIAPEQEDATPIDRRLSAAQFYAEVSREIFDNPQLFVRSQPTAQDGEEESETSLAQLWTRFLESRIAVWSALICLVLPIAAAITYYGFIATDRYATDLQLTLRSRSGHLSLGTIMPGTIGASAGFFASPDLYVMAAFIRSREAMTRVGRSVDLREVWGRPEADPLSRLPKNATTEDLLEIWQRYVGVSVDPLSGSLQVEIEAFRPADTDRIGDALVRTTEEAVNELTERVRLDGQRFAETTLTDAETRLAKARAEVTAFRERAEAVTPVKTAGANFDTITTLMQKKLALERELDRRRRELTDDSPVIRRLNTDLETVGAQIDELKRQAMTPTGGGRAGFSSQLMEYDELLTRQMLDEKLYGVALDLLDGARATAQSQQMYVTPFVRPKSSNDARYPYRTLGVLRIAGLSLLAWLGALLLLGAVREDFVDEA